MKLIFFIALFSVSFQQEVLPVADPVKIVTNPTVDQFKGFYNVRYRDVYPGGTITGKKKQEFHFSGTQDLPPLRMPEISQLMTRLRQISSEFEPPFDPFDDSRNVIDASPASGRSMAVAFYDQKQLTLENCEKIQKLLKTELPLWRVGIVCSIDADTPIIYPDVIAIPIKYQQGPKEYWPMLQAKEVKAFWNRSEGLRLMEKSIVAEHVKRDSKNMFAELAKGRFAFLAFRGPLFKNYEGDPGWRVIHVWLVTENPPFPDGCYVPRERRFGFVGAGVELLMKENGEVSRLDTINTDIQKKEQTARIYCFAFEEKEFDEKFIPVHDPSENKSVPLRLLKPLELIDVEELKRRFAELKK